MTLSTVNFTTGPATLPDVGTLSYNGCIFSPLFTSNISGTAVKDNAQRTVKLMQYTLTVDGYVTLAAGNQSIAPTMDNLRKMLEAQGGTLTYKGRGFDLFVNAAGQALFGNAVRDVAWGPVPETIEFQPLGGGLSAKVVWTVTVRVVDITAVGKSGLLQFNCDTVVSYGEDYFSSLSVSGTMEIPLTRTSQKDRTLKTTVDDRRSELDSRIFDGINLERFRVVRRDYTVSRDKRTMEFNVQVEEKPYMDLPPGCTLANGTYSVKPAAAGAGLCNWLCTLSATYTVRADTPRQVAYYAFLSLLRLRMAQSILGYKVGLDKDKDQDVTPAFIQKAKNIANKTKSPVTPGLNLMDAWEKMVTNYPLENRIVNERKRAHFIPGSPVNAFMINFSIDEGLYLDSKTTSFSATWRLVTTFEMLFEAAGVWRKLPEENTAGKNLWAIYMKDISGSTSWLANKLDPKLDIVVDFGGG